MEKILKFQQHNKYIGCVVSLAKELKASYGGSYSVWIGTECIDFGLSLDSANEIYNEFLNN
jgi:hypothetical protein